MKKLTLKKLKIQNFKKIESLEIDFSSKTVIKADNGVGKTTVFDAFTWCLFGKDSLGSTQFEIKKLDNNNEPVHKKEHCVTAIIDCDGTVHEIKRIYREKWTKKRGDEQESFDGHETIYDVNGMIYKKKDFEGFVSGIIDENIFKLLTSATHFHSLKWEERRKILYSLVDNTPNSEIAKGNEDFEKLINFLGNKDFEAYRTEIKQKISPIKKELESLNAKIEGTEKNISSDIDVLTLRKELESLGDPNVINKEIIAERSRIQAEIQKKQLEHNQVENKKLQDYFEKKRIVDLRLQNYNQCLRSVELCNQKREQLLKDWHTENNRVFSSTECHVCGIDSFEVQKVLLGVNSEEAVLLYEKLAEKNVSTEDAFNSAKAENLKKINQSGAENNAIKESLLKEIEETKKWLSENPIEETAPQSTPFDDSELIKQMPELKEVDSTIINRIAEINQLLGRQEEIETMKQRLADDKKKAKELSSSLASLEKTQFVCDKFARVKSDIFVEKINGLFTFVKFKLYETQINGGQVECCETLVDGVPYSTNVNTGAKINAGIDIVNVLSNHYKTFCPVFLDNMESCTKPIDICGQSVHLVVKEGLKKLEIINL